MKYATVYISHRHVGRPIAEISRQFVDEASLGGARTYISDDNRYAVSPRAAVKEVLRHADALFMIYTDADADWGECMWEYGVCRGPGAVCTVRYCVP